MRLAMRRLMTSLVTIGEHGTLTAALSSLQLGEWVSSHKIRCIFVASRSRSTKVGMGSIYRSRSINEQEILARWKVTVHCVSSLQDEGQGEVDRNQVREAQALARSLFWLSTRSKPDLAFGVAAVSRLMTKNPKKVIEVAQALLSYIKGTPGDLHYTGKVHSIWGARGTRKGDRGFR